MTPEEIKHKAEQFGKRARELQPILIENGPPTDNVHQTMMLESVISEFDDFVRTIPAHHLQVMAGVEFSKARFE